MESRMTASYVREVKRWEELSKMEKELMDMDNSVVIVGRGGQGLNGRGLNANWKNTIKIKLKREQKCDMVSFILFYF